MSRMAMLLSIALLSLCGAAVAAKQTAGKSQSAAKPFRGEPSVDGGAAIYRIPIELPAGTSSFRPNISISYSSRSGNGPLGMGTNLAAGGAVHRCPFIFDGDGFSREVQYAPDDRLCIDGTKLRLFKGDYGKDGSLYMPETESGFVVKLFGNLNDPGAGFGSFDTANNVNFYQVPVVPEGAPAPLSWLLSHSLNKDGRAIQYFYDRLDHGEVLLREIRYGGKFSSETKAITGSNNFVRFSYASRADVTSSFLIGEQRQTRILEKVSTGILEPDDTATLLREYAFSYRASKGTGRSLLASVLSCQDLAARTRCLLPNQFNWQDAETEFAPPMPMVTEATGNTLAPAWHPGDAVPALTTFFAGGDFNADGRRELVARSADDKVSVFVVDMAAQLLHQANVTETMRIADFALLSSGLELRHVGSADVIGDVGGKLAVMPWDGKRFAPPVATALPYTGDTTLMYASGDGQVDVVAGSRAGEQYLITLYRNEGSSDKQFQFSQGEVVARFPWQDGLHLDSRVSLDGTGRALLVSDRQHVRHIVRFSSEADGKLKTRAFEPSDIGIDADALTRGFLFADINGDGYDDIVYTSGAGNWQIQLNRGFRFAAPIDTGVRDVRSAVGRAGTLVVDIDSDGRSDLIFPARRILDFCIDTPDKDTLCSDALDSSTPQMDLGLYEYDAIDFRLDAAGNQAPRLRRDLNLVGQANRMRSADIFGDGLMYLVSPFDRGVANGHFRAADGTLVDCPPKFYCGAHIARPAHVSSKERSDAALDLLAAVEQAPGTLVRWSYYPIANPVRNLYNVPALGSPERYIDTRRYYFTSSMYVVGEEEFREGDGGAALTYEYGGGQYNTAGRGFDGFKWIIVHSSEQRKKFGSWFGQDGPYRGMVERSWSEDESDEENDYLHGSPGAKFLDYEKFDVHCAGPRDNPVTRRYHCTATDTPYFSASKEPAK